MEDFSKHIIIHVVHTDTVTEGEGSVKSKSLDIWSNANLNLASFAVSMEVAENAIRFKVEHGEVVFERGSTQCRSSSLPFVLA